MTPEEYKQAKTKLTRYGQLFDKNVDKFLPAPLKFTKAGRVAKRQAKYTEQSLEYYKAQCSFRGLTVTGTGDDLREALQLRDKSKEDEITREFVILQSQTQDFEDLNDAFDAYIVQDDSESDDGSDIVISSSKKRPTTSNLESSPNPSNVIIIDDDSPADSSSGDSVVISPSLSESPNSIPRERGLMLPPMSIPGPRRYPSATPRHERSPPTSSPRPSVIRTSPRWRERSVSELPTGTSHFLSIQPEHEETVTSNDSRSPYPQGETVTGSRSVPQSQPTSQVNTPSSSSNNTPRTAFPRPLQTMPTVNPSTNNWSITGQWLISCPDLATHNSDDPADLTMTIFIDIIFPRFYAKFDFNTHTGVMRIQPRKHRAEFFPLDFSDPRKLGEYPEYEYIWRGLDAEQEDKRPFEDRKVYYLSFKDSGTTFTGDFGSNLVDRVKISGRKVANGRGRAKSSHELWEQYSEKKWKDKRKPGAEVIDLSD